MSYSLALASLALAALGIELQRMIQRDNGGVDFGVAAARAIFGSVVWFLFRLGRLGDVLEALVSLPFVLFVAHTFPEGLRTHSLVVRATTLVWFACGLVLVAVDFIAYRCVGHSHSILDRLLTRDDFNEELAEEYVKWRKDYNRQLQHLAALAGDLSSTSKEFNARLPLFRGGLEAEPRRPNCPFWTSQEVKMEEFSIFHRLCKSALSSPLVSYLPPSHIGLLASSGLRHFFRSNTLNDRLSERPRRRMVQDSPFLCSVGCSRKQETHPRTQRGNQNRERSFGRAQGRDGVRSS